MSDSKMDQQVTASKRLMMRISNNDEARQLFSGIGVDVATTVKQGESLCAAVETADNRQGALDAKIKGKWQQIHKLHDPQWDLYKDHRVYAKKKITSAEVRELLKLAGNQADSRPSQLAQMSPFYEQALLNEEALSLLASVDISRAALEQGHSACTQMHALEDDIALLETEKKAATHEKKTALDALEAWYSKLEQGYDFATADKPEVRARLRLFEE